MTLVDAEQALANSEASKRSRWPTQADADNRLFPECHPHLQPKFTIASDARVFAIGSCFARNIEEYLVRLGLDVISSSLEFPASEMGPNSRRNDLLVKYTPPSILQELRYALDEGCSPDEQLRYLVPLQSGRTVDLNLPSWYSSVAPERALQRRRQINSLFARIRSADLVIITLGLIEAWYDKVADGFICEVPTRTLVKEYPGRFAFVRLDFLQARRYTQEAIDLIQRVNPNAKIVLTTSPVPLGRTYTDADIIVANGYSKSMLRAIAGEISSGDPRVDYFPSYEMVTLSDPRSSWKSDQRHATDYRVGDVVRTFISSYIPTPASETMAMRQRYIDAKILYSKRQFANALQELQAIAPHFANDQVFLNDLRLAAEGAGNWSLMKEIHRRLDKIMGRSAKRDIPFANCLAKLGRHEEALEIAESIGSKNVGAVLVKIDALIALDRKQTAGELARSMLRELQLDRTGAPRHDWIYIRLARSFRALGAHESAALVHSIGGKA